MSRWCKWHSWTPQIIFTLFFWQSFKNWQNSQPNQQCFINLLIQPLQIEHLNNWWTICNMATDGPNHSKWHFSLRLCHWNWFYILHSEHHIVQDLLGSKPWALKYKVDGQTRMEAKYYNHNNAGGWTVLPIYTQFRVCPNWAACCQFTTHCEAQVQIWTGFLMYNYHTESKKIFLHKLVPPFKHPQITFPSGWKDLL